MVIFAHNKHTHYDAFASMIITGVNNNNAISGHFIVRGQNVSYGIDDAAADDFL